jgi:hypothetical protein
MHGGNGLKHHVIAVMPLGKLYERTCHQFLIVTEQPYPELYVVPNRQFCCMLMDCSLDLGRRLVIIAAEAGVT